MIKNGIITLLGSETIFKNSEKFGSISVVFYFRKPSKKEKYIDMTRSRPPENIQTAMLSTIFPIKNKHSNQSRYKTRASSRKQSP